MCQGWEEVANEAFSSGQLVSAGFMLEVHEVHGKDPRYSLLLLIFIDIPHKGSILLFPCYKLPKKDFSCFQNFAIWYPAHGKNMSEECLTHPVNQDGYHYAYHSEQKNTSFSHKSLVLSADSEATTGSAPCQMCWECGTWTGTNMLNMFHLSRNDLSLMRYMIIWNHND